MLKKLCMQAFPSRGANSLETGLSEVCDEVMRDRFNNIIGRKYGTSGKKILIDAHCDEIALVISEITENGMLKFQTAGGIDPKILPCSEVTVHGKRAVYGIIGAKPPHLLSASEAEKAMKISDLTIDTGLKNPGEVVSIGDFATFRPNFRVMEGGFVCSKSLDNRAGLWAAVNAVSALKNCPHEITVLASSGEELGCVGASGALCDISPDMAIVVDVTFGASHALHTDECFELGSGAAVCTGPNISKRLFDNVCEAARLENIPFEIEVESGDAGTNAGVIQLSGEGVPTCMISIPLRYMHTECEVVKLSDLDAAASLIAKVCEIGGGILD